MNLRKTAVTGVIALSALSIPAVAFTSGSAHAAPLADCRTTVTHHHSVTSAGTVSDYTMTKHACGRQYTEHETGSTRTAKGSVSTFVWDKNGTTGGCWSKEETRITVSAKGTRTVTVTNTGNC